MEPTLHQRQDAARKSSTSLYSVNPHLRSLPYEARLRHLGLWTLEERRNRADLIEVFKIAKGLSSTLWSRFFHKAEGTVTRGHSWKLVKRNCCCDTRLYFFSQRVINRWNSLSQVDVDASSINLDVVTMTWIHDSTTFVRLLSLVYCSDIDFFLFTRHVLS